MKKSKIRVFRKITIILLVLLLQLWSTEWCGAQNASKIDWLQGYVSSTGRGYAKKTGSPIDNDKAVTAAKVIAKRELLEAIKGVKIDYQTAVSDLITESNETSARVQGVLHNAMQVGDPQIKEESAYVIAVVEMRVCLFDNAAGCRLDESLVSALPKLSSARTHKDTSCDLLPNLTSTQEILSRISYDTSKPLNLVLIKIGGKPFNSGSNDFAIGFESAKGQNCSIYTPEKIDPIVRRDRGSAEVFLRISDAEKKYGSNVLKVTAKSISQDNYIMIDKKDAYLINLINDQAKQELFRHAKFGIAVN